MTLAIMVTMFDIEIDRSRAQKIDPCANGRGAQRFKNTVPFKNRRRTQDSFLNHYWQSKFQFNSVKWSTAKGPLARERKLALRLK